MATRRERVILELQDDFTSGMARAAAATAILDKELKSLSGNAVKSRSATRDIEQETKKLGNTAGGSAREVDRLSGRLGILVDSAVLLGPALAPITSVGVAGFAGLASEIGFAVAAAGTAILAFQGVGDALKAVNKAALDPTDSNLQAARLAMEALSPAARQFVNELHKLTPELDRLRGIAATNMFPGLTAGLDQLITVTPEVERIVAAISAELGHLGEEAGRSLASDKWAPFLQFVETEAPVALSDMGKAVGNVAHALAEVWMAFQPLERDFGSWLVSTSRDLDRWATGLDQTQGFQDFVSYIRETGPQVARTLGDMALAFVAIGRAAAPLGGPVLSALDAIAKIVTAIADSPLGTPIYTAVAAMVAFNRATKLTSKSVDGLKGGLSGLSTGGKLGVAVLGIEALTTAVDKLFDKSLDGSNLDRSLAALSGGDVTGELKDKFGSNLSGLLDQLQQATAGSEAVHRAFSRIPVLGDIQDAGIEALSLGKTTGYKTATDNVKQLDQALASMVESGNASEAKSIVDQILKAGATADEVSKGFKEYGIAVQNAEDTGAAFTTELARENQVMVEQRANARQMGEQWLQFGQNLDDTKVSLDGWIHSLEQQAKALRDFADNAQQAADKGLRRGLIAELEKAGPAGALRMQQLANATDAEIRRANRAWASGRQAIRDYINQTVPTKTIDVNTAPAKAKIRDLINLIAGIPGVPNDPTKPGPSISMPGVTPQHPKKPSGTSAEGGTIPKSGRGYADRYLYMLADGEEVISNRRGQADRYRPLLKAINAAADGATVGLHSYVANTLDMAWPHGLKEWNRALAESTKVLEREKSQRQDLISQRDQLKDTLTNAFRSDLFAQPSTPSIWMSAADRNKAGIGDVFSTLTGDITNATAYQAALKKLKARGLHGGALGALAASGSLADVQAFAGASAADIKRFQTLYGQRQSVTAGLGGFANDVYGSALGSMTKQLRSIAHENSLLRHEVAKLEKHLKRSTPKRRP